MIVSFRDQTNRLVRINQEDIVEIPIASVNEPVDSLDQTETMGEELNQPRSLKDYM